jgi:hypothetical protein
MLGARADGPSAKFLHDVRAACDVWYAATTDAERAAALARVEELAGPGGASTTVAGAPPAAASPPTSMSTHAGEAPSLAATASPSLSALLSYYGLGQYTPALASALGIFDVADLALLGAGDVVRLELLKPIHRAKLLGIARDVRDAEEAGGERLPATASLAAPRSPFARSAMAPPPPLPSWPPMSPAARRRAEARPSPSPRAARQRDGAAARLSGSASIASIAPAASVPPAVTRATAPALAPIGAFVLVRNVRFRPDLIDAMFAERADGGGRIAGGGRSGGELQRPQRTEEEVLRGNPNPRYWVGRVTALLSGSGESGGGRASLQLYDELPVGSSDYTHTARHFDVDLVATYPLAAGQMEFDGARLCWHCSPSPLWAGDDVLPVPQRLAQSLRAATSVVELSAALVASPALRSMNPSPPTLTRMAHAVQSAVEVALVVGEGAAVGVRPSSADAQRGGSRLWSCSLAESSALHEAYAGGAEVLKLGSLHSMHVVVTCRSVTPDGRLRDALGFDPCWREGSAAQLAARVGRALKASAALRAELERWGYDLLSTGHCAVTAGRANFR